MKIKVSQRKNLENQNMKDGTPSSTEVMIPQPIIFPHEREAIYFPLIG